jgi:hypothetical protein
MSAAMNIQVRAVALASSVICLQPLATAAQVQGVSVAPSSPVVNQPATVTITGQNPCTAVIIDLGTGGIVPTTQIAGLPHSLQHTWTTTGRKTVTAIGQGACTGHASQTFQVKDWSSLLRLCAQVSCAERPKMSFLNPRISATFGFNTPGGVLAIAGTNFGPKLGSVAVTLRTWSGTVIQRALAVTEWTDTLVGVTWPTDIGGLLRQSAALALTTGEGKRDWRSITFFPELELKTLPRVDVQVLSCGDDGNFDQCNQVRDDDDLVDLDGRPGQFESPIHAIVATHVNAWAAVGNDSGTDQYRITLYNGWTLEDLHWAVGVDPGQGWAKKPSGFAKGATWSPSIQWLVTPNDRISYFAVVTIAGPRGVPHR